MTTTRIPQSKQPMALEHYQKLVEAKRKAEAALQKCIADLLAFEVVIRKPVILTDWPGRPQARLRTQLAQLEAAGHVPSHD
jgi:hypothetical protein